MNSELRSPKPEASRKSEIRISLERQLRSFRLAGRRWPAFRISDFGFPSDFGFRISDLIGAAVALALVTFGRTWAVNFDLAGDYAGVPARILITAAVVASFCAAEMSSTSCSLTASLLTSSW